MDFDVTTARGGGQRRRWHPTSIAFVIFDQRPITAAALHEQRVTTMQGADRIGIAGGLGSQCRAVDAELAAWSIAAVNVVVVNHGLVMGIRYRVGADAIFRRGATKTANHRTSIDERMAPRVARDVVGFRIDQAARDPASATIDPYLEPTTLGRNDRHRLPRLERKHHMLLLAGLAVDLGWLIRDHFVGDCGPGGGKHSRGGGQQEPVLHGRAR